jgi:LmbE family N-acetylglucosaminyl deacetylase
LAKYSVLAVFAHPDDESAVGPLLAKYARLGHDVYLASLTTGQKGVRKHFGVPAGEELGAVRAGELRCAAQELGIHEPILRGFEDQGVSAPGALGPVVEAVRGAIERTRADVVITWGPDGITGHPDHRTASNATTMAVQEMGDGGPRKLYYVAYPASRLERAPEALRRGRRFYTVSDAFVTTEEDCREDAAAGLRALECHRSQWDPERMEQLKRMHEEAFEGRVFLRLALTQGAARGREGSILDGLE